ncbi:hypothetical protein [Marinobacter shengliensis]|uniref:hypothetical protein n=1 Tax=Marinobacter shengliensis TaxID=1389223 RepID=UPI002572D9C4|nr:hypothetical protein [Marinobacter shengliensis]BEH13962.1 hypothetical protein MAALD49_13300 [Marinobacter shengliensis]
MFTDTLSNIDYINKFLAPNLDNIERQYSPIGKEVGIDFDSLTLGRFKSGKKLDPFEIQVLASFTGIYSLDEIETPERTLRLISEIGFASAEARLSIQLRLLQNQAVRTGVRVNHYVYLPGDIDLYVYVDPDGAWFSNVEEADFIEHRNGLTNKVLKHIKYCAKKMQNREQQRGNDSTFSLRFSKR